MEAWASAQGSPNYLFSHITADQFFGTVKTSDYETFPDGAPTATSARAVYNFQRIGMKATVEKTFVTPIPAQLVSGKNWDGLNGAIKVMPPKSGP